MKHIVGLYESGDHGKTMTLNTLIYIMELATVGIPTIHSLNEDRREVFNYNGYRIGIATGGDNWEVLDENCKFFEDNQCDIVFTATRKRSDSGSVERILDFAKKYGLEVEWIGKDLVSPTQNINTINFLQAITLFKKYL